MQGTKILIVEDENIVALDMMNRLRQFGYDVVAKASNGRTALKAVEEKTPDLVLMDIKLSGPIDGITTAGKIREIADVPVIFITAYADKETLNRAKVTDAFGYLIKPYNDRELYTNIEIALYKHAMEKRVKESEQWLEVTLNSITDGVIATNKDNTVRFMNPAAEKLSGYSVAESRGRDINTICELSDDAEYSSLLEKDPSRIATHNYFLRSKSGEAIPIEMQKASIGSEKDDIGGSVYVFRDISERRAFELELEKARIKAEAANKAKSTFLANITHELRTPLNSIIGMSELCLEAENDKEIPEYLSIVKEAGVNLLSLINSILDYSTFESGKMTITKDPFKPNILLQRVIDQFIPRLRRKKLRMMLLIKPGVPRTLIGDEGGLRKIVTHLVDNAIKFTSMGEVRVHLSLFDTDRIHIEVQDTGVGMAEQDKERIFSAFTQADGSYTRIFGGPGLGLSIVKNMVDFFKGSIWVNSQKNEGSAFHIVIPFDSEGGEIFEEPFEYIRDFTDDQVYDICPATDAVTVIKTIKDLAVQGEYDKIEEVIVRVKDEWEKLHPEMGEMLFKLVLAARREDIDGLYKELDVCRRLL